MSTALLETPAMHDTAPFAEFPPRRSSAWLEVLCHLDRSYGGLTAVVPSLSANLLAHHGMAVRLAAFCTPDENPEAAKSAPIPTTVWPAGHSSWLKDAGLRERFADAVEASDGVHVHGLWDASSMVGTRAARRLNKPCIVSAHGMLEPWALAQKAWKKRVYGALVERPALQSAACLHALTLAEAEDYRRFGCTAPIAVIPNAVEAPKDIDRGWIEERFPQIAGRRVVLFLGRLHVKKGIELLLQAWSNVRVEYPDALLMLAGPGEEDYVRTLQARATELGIGNNVLFAGMLDQAAKWSALSRAHVFVLPSYSEGLSVAALESLCVGTPAIVTEACHLPEVADCAAGWQIETDAEELKTALRESLETSASDRLTLGRNARQLAARRFSWDVVSAKMAELYDCVLGGSTPQLSLYRKAGQ